MAQISPAGFSNLGLFDAPPPEGLIYRPDYITPYEEAGLITQIDKAPWSIELQRRRQWYGGSYQGLAERIGIDGVQAYHAGAYPAWLNAVGQRLCQDGITAFLPNRAGVNEYLPGQGIGHHMDQDNHVLNAVAILSLGSAIMMEFVRPQDKPHHDVRTCYLQRRSLLLIAGEARYKWMHGIPARKSDRVGGLILPRARRLSIMFRAKPD